MIDDHHCLLPTRRQLFDECQHAHVELLANADRGTKQADVKQNHERQRLG
jgi:hypothetical protein